MTKPDLVLLHAPSNYDFRERAIMYGPISDVIPSTPLFEMYPIGFVSIAAYLEKNGVATRIVNIANRMLTEPRFDVERFLSKLSPLAFGIDLHWLPHAHGSLELAQVIKQLHPSTPTVFGGFSASYFYQELIRYPQVDFVIRGDSAEEPMLKLMQRIKAGASVADVPNLSWKDGAGTVYHNPLSSVLSDLDGIPLDYAYPVRSVLKYRGLSSLLPFNNWLDYPLTAVFTCRGCTLNCLSCGGSRFFFKNVCHRDKPAYRHPQLLAKDIKSIQRYLNGPVFIIGDIRQPGEDYAEELLQAMSGNGIKGPIVLELFAPASEGFLQRVKKAIPNFSIQMSPESHDEEIRRAFGKGWSTPDIENTIESALNNGCQRFDLFFMIGLPKQDHRSVMDTVAYCRALLQEFGKERRLHPMISPLSPFIDPGSEVFEHAEDYGYHLFYRTLEEHRQALLRPSWKYMLSYETQWLSRDEIVDATYEAALGLNGIKEDYGLISAQAAAQVESRIRQSLSVIQAIDRLVAEQGFGFQGEPPLKYRMKELSLATTCQKRELEWPAKSFFRSIFRSMPGVLYSLCRRS
jgi:B12-binding domain/radical SAM domain protein